MFRSFDINGNESLIIDTKTGTAMRINVETGEYRIIEDTSMWQYEDVNNYSWDY